MGKVQIAERLKAAREMAGLTQDAAAKALGVTYQAISNWERGVTRVDTDALQELSSLYNASITWIITGGTESDFEIDLEHYSVGAREVALAYDKASQSVKDGVRRFLGLAMEAYEAPAVYLAARDGGGFEPIEDQPQAEIAERVVLSGKKSKKLLP